MNNNSFDESKFYLGKLCPRKHHWQGEDKSLRNKNGDCLECRKIYVSDWQKKNRDKVNAAFKRWKEKNPEKFAESQRKYWEKPENLESRKKYSAEYRQREDYPEKHRRGNKKYSQTDKGKAVHKKAITKFRQSEAGKAMAREYVKRRRAVRESVHATCFTEEERLKRFELFNGECAYCGKPAKCLDHFLPITKGGSHVLNNLVPACKSCNSSKFNHNPQDWYPKQPFYSKKRWKKILAVLGKTESTINQLPLF